MAGKSATDGANGFIFGTNSKLRRSRKSRWKSFATSLLLHAGIIAIAFLTPSIPDDTLLRAEVAALTAPDRGPRVIWLRKGDRLPRISSGDPAPLQMPKSEDRKERVLFTLPKRAAEQKQFIFTSVPQIPNQQVIPSPNVLSFTLNQQKELKPPRELKEFKAPESPKPAGPKNLSDEVPDVKPQTDAGVPLPSTIATVTNPRLMRPPAKKFTAPPLNSGGDGGGTRVMDAPAATPDAGSGGGTGSVTYAIVSASPADVAPPPPPAGNRNDLITVGGSQSGAGSGAGGGSGAIVPGLNARDGTGTGSTIGALGSNVTPSASEISGLKPTRPPAVPLPVNSPTVAIPQWPSSRRVPANVDMAFKDRPVYATIVQGPAGSGEWVMWFGDSQPAPPGVRSLMRPPVPRSVGWINIEGAEKLPDSVWVSARLTKDGHFTEIGVGKVVSPVLAAGLTKIVESWLFSPALKNGDAIESDVLIEMVFRHTAR